MGLEVRSVQEDQPEAIKVALLNAGFEVRVVSRQVQSSADCPITVYYIIVSSARDSITLHYHARVGRWGDSNIYIPNIGAWSPRRNRERRAFQARVTEVLESAGAYGPAPMGSSHRT